MYSLNFVLAVLATMNEDIRYHAVFNVLNRLDIALLIADISGRIILKNECADELIDASPYLKISPSGKLISIDKSTQSAINHAIVTASSAACRNAQSAKQLFRLGDNTNDSLLLEITQLDDATGEFKTGFCGAMIRVIAPNRSMTVPLDVLKLQYGLTHSEAEVAALLSNGHSYNTVAESRNVQHETVKTQVSSLFRKMKTDSRAGLVSRVLSISLPFKES